LTLVFSVFVQAVINQILPGDNVTAFECKL